MKHGWLTWVPVTRTRTGERLGPWFAPGTGLPDGIWVTEAEASAVAAEHRLPFDVDDPGTQGEAARGAV